LCVALLGFAPGGLTAAAASNSVTLAWNPSPSTGALGYYVCAGVASGQYTNRVDVGNVTNATLSGLQKNTTYYLTVVAYGTQSQESPPSNEVQYSLPTNSPAPTLGLLSAGANPALPGQAVAVTMTVSAAAPAQGTPSGSVQFRVDGLTVGAPLPLISGSATCTLSNLGHGTHSVLAEYPGDPDFVGTTNQLASPVLINTPPVAAPDSFLRDPTNGVELSLAGLLSNDRDEDGDALTFTGLSASSANGATLIKVGNWIYYFPQAGFTNRDTFTYTVTDTWGATASGLVSLDVQADNAASPSLTISDLGDGTFLILGDGIPDFTYSIQFTEGSPLTNWQTFATATADSFGVFVTTNGSGQHAAKSQGSSQRFFRAVYP
jgi:hypothetical protein